jgi:UDP-N-acetylmuramoyl-tripeptide--D-alanyl-D-alanine ligase
MSARFTKKEIIEVLSLKFKEKLRFSHNDSKIVSEGLEFDSRNIKGGEIFVALPGEKEHGHNYVQSAYDRGAAIIIVEDSKFLDNEIKENIICVENAQEALWELARFWRKKLNLPTIAVTGSVGKTTTKEILASILVQKGAGCYAQKSFNNHIGVPYTILKSNSTHQWMVLEIGMNRPGEISALSKLSTPNVSVVTEVAPAHIGAFDSLKGIGYEKLSISDGLEINSAFILNGDNPIIREVVAEKKLNEKFRIKYVGYNADNDFILDEVKSNGFEGISFRVQKSQTYNLNIPGVHNAKNAAIAVAAVKALFPDFELEKISKGLNQFTAPLMRLNWKETKNKIAVLDDSYNANPASMSAMLDIAADAKKSGKKIGLILGTMRELGAFSEQYHKELGVKTASITPDFVCYVGEFEQSFSSGLSQIMPNVDYTSCESPVEAAEIAFKKSVDIIFVKASRGIGLDKTVEILVAG